MNFFVGELIGVVGSEENGDGGDVGGLVGVIEWCLGDDGFFYVGIG